MMALAMEKWNLHKRIALKLLVFIGVSPGRILVGFMATSAFLSMWISNTATTMMMVPIALAIVLNLEDLVGKEPMKRYAIGIFLGIAYSASIGGVATLIGTPPNLSFARILNIFFPQAPEISFAKWFLFALPISIFFLLVVWLLLARFFAPKEKLHLDKK